MLSGLCKFCLFCFLVTPISDYSWEVYIVHSGVFAHCALHTPVHPLTSYLCFH